MSHGQDIEIPRRNTVVTICISILGQGQGCLGLMLVTLP